MDVQTGLVFPTRGSSPSSAEQQFLNALDTVPGNLPTDSTASFQRHRVSRRMRGMPSCIPSHCKRTKRELATCRQANNEASTSIQIPDPTEEEPFKVPTINDFHHYTNEKDAECLYADIIIVRDGPAQTCQGDETDSQALCINWF